MIDESAFEESALLFDCHGSRLIGVMAKPLGVVKQAVLIVVGGPQYRVGSHRQFVLLSRRMAECGIASLRFDYRGMGDSEGQPIDFLRIADDIECAIAQLYREVPNLSGIIIWGLCDAASAALTYAYRDARVVGLVLLNPWVRSAESEARAYVKHYYRQRVLQLEFWKKFVGGNINWGSSLSSIATYISRMIMGIWPLKKSSNGSVADGLGAVGESQLADQMASGFDRFSGPVLFALSGNDLVAAEFRELASRSSQWRRLMKRDAVTVKEVPGATHTFSSETWRSDVAESTVEWILSQKFGPQGTSSPTGNAGGRRLEL